jgi:hypothetical protein
MLRQRGRLSDPARWLELPRNDGNSRIRTYLDTESGCIRRFDELPRQLIVSRPDRKSFSQSTIAMTDNEQDPLLVDPGDLTMWRLEDGAGGLRLTAVALPDEQRLAGVRPEFSQEREGWMPTEWERVVLEGERERYVWTTSGFLPAGSPAPRPYWSRYCRSEAAETSLAAMTVRLRDLEGGNIVYLQRYEPRTLGEHARVALMRVGLLCGPPVLSAQRLIADSGAPLFADVLPSPTELPKDSPVFHLAHAMLGLVLGVFAWLRVARRGGTLPERALWGGFALFFGVFALCFLLMLAPRPGPATHVRARRAAAQPSATPLAAI